MGNVAAHCYIREREGERGPVTEYMYVEKGYKQLKTQAEQHTHHRWGEPGLFFPRLYYFHLNLILTYKIKYNLIR